MTKASKDWVDDELAGCRFADERLGRRLHALLGQMAGAMGESIPAGLPGLGRHQGGLPLLHQPPGRRGRHPRRATSRPRATGASPRPRPDPGPPRHDRVQLQARAAPSGSARSAVYAARTGRARVASTPSAGC